jgi:hypothetical protein
MIPRRAILIAVVTVSVVCSSASAQASPERHPASSPPTEAHAAAAIPQFLKNVARRFWRSPPRRIATRFSKRVIRRSVSEWLSSGGTECQFPLPESFCSVRTRWGLGQALWYNGLRPGVWNRTYSPRFQVRQPLVPGYVYYLSCWRLGDRISGPYGSTNLWYFVPNGGYVSDALLYTGTNSVISGVRHC